MKRLWIIGLAVLGAGPLGSAAPSCRYRWSRPFAGADRTAIQRPRPGRPAAVARPGDKAAVHAGKVRRATADPDAAADGTATRPERSDAAGHRGQCRQRPEADGRHADGPSAAAQDRPG